MDDNLPIDRPGVAGVDVSAARTSATTTAVAVIVVFVCLRMMVTQERVSRWENG